MLGVISALLEQKGISLVAPVPLSRCHITRRYLLEREEILDGTAFMIAVPYYTTECDDPARNISAYAVGADYHVFFKQLFDELLPLLRARFAQNRFAGFADHSPIAEVDAAAKAGLGVRGCNHLLLTERYSSFVFLGEIITDAVIDVPAREPKDCSRCGACERACPVALDSRECLSALSQCKGELTPKAEQALLRERVIWGCDQCQQACPVTLAAKKNGSIYSELRFFKDSAIPHLSPEALSAMSEEEFAARAYSWRGRAVIGRNLELAHSARERSKKQ